MGQYSTGIIRGADGPTAVSVIKRNSKLTLKQKIGRLKYNVKRAYVEATIKAKSTRRAVPSPRRAAASASMKYISSTRIKG